MQKFEAIEEVFCRESNTERPPSQLTVGEWEVADNDHLIETSTMQLSEMKETSPAQLPLKMN
jgi:hypothetical protein